AVEHDRDTVEEVRRARLVERGAEDLELVQVLAADVDEDVGGADRVRRDEAALDQAVRHREHDLAVLERARLGLVGVDDEVRRLAGALREEARLLAHREARAAAAADVRGEQLVEHGLRLEAARSLELRIAADRAEVVDRPQVAAGIHAPEDEPLLAHPRSSWTIAGTSSAFTGSR